MNLQSANLKIENLPSVQPARERVFVCTSTTGGELASLRVSSKPTNSS